jgi:hypothetical protein
MRETKEYHLSTHRCGNKTKYRMNTNILNQQTNGAKIQSMMYLITGITTVEDLKNATFFHNDINEFIKGSYFQRCYWGPHIP